MPVVFVNRAIRRRISGYPSGAPRLPAAINRGEDHPQRMLVDLPALLDAVQTQDVDAALAAVGRGDRSSGAGQVGIFGGGPAFTTPRSSRQRMRRKTVRKGDVAGHEFHGNQYVSGEVGQRPDEPYHDYLKRIDNITVAGGPAHFSSYGDAVPGGYNGGFVLRNDAGTEMGHIDYNSASGYPVLIAMVETEPAFRGRGVAMALLQRVHEDFPKEKIDFGMQTEAGGKLREAWQAQHPETVVKGEDMDRLDVLKAEGALLYAVYKQTGNIGPVEDWYETGAGSDQIDWGTEGAMTRCHDLASDYMDDQQAWGFCTDRRMAVGAPVVKREAFVK